MNPNPEVFAKHVLWKLSTIQADVYRNQMLLEELLAKSTGQEVAAIQKKWKAETERMSMERFFESLDAVGIARDSGQTPGGDRFHS